MIVRIGHLMGRTNQVLIFAAIFFFERFSFWILYVLKGSYNNIVIFIRSYSKKIVLIKKWPNRSQRMSLDQS